MPISQLGRVALGEAALDPDLVAELHEADAVGREGLGGLAAGVGLLGQELLGRERPQRARARQQVLDHLGAAAAGARRLLREDDRGAGLAAAADQLRVVRRPGEHVGGEGDLGQRPSSGDGPEQGR